MQSTSIIQGFLVGASLIIAIGPQNAFVLNQGLKRQHVFLTALVCSLSDLILISAGVFGLGSIFSLHPLLTEFARWFGALFLFGYGFLSFMSFDLLSLAVGRNYNKIQNYFTGYV